MTNVLPLWRSSVNLSVLCGKAFKTLTTEETEVHRETPQRIARVKRENDAWLTADGSLL
jgi:hypothetical protein